MWVNGRRQPAASTRSGDVTNPATGVVVRTVPFCNDSGYRRGRAGREGGLPRVAQDAGVAARARAHALSRPDRAASRRARGAHHRRARQDARRCVGFGPARPRSRRVRDGHPAPHERRAQRRGRHRRRHPFAARAARRVRGHHALQLPRDGADVDVSGGDRVRQHVRAEAFGESALDRDAAGGALQGSGLAGRRVERRARRQAGRGRAAHPPGRAGRVLRGLDAHRAIHLRDVRQARQARAGARRREESRRGAAGCGPRFRRRRADRRGLRLGGRALHGDFRDRRGGRHRRCAREEARGQGGQPQDRRRASARISTWGRW